jgi:outer membrane immunogenic protein
MKQGCLGLFLAAVLSSQTQAADFAPPAHDWTQCYVGAHFGGLWGDEDWKNKTPGGAYYGESLGGHDLDGIIGGGQAGCDYQFDGGFVIGLQGDYGWSDAKGSHPSAHETGVTYGSEVESLASVNARLGYAWDEVLGYVKGGVAWERDEAWAYTTMLGLAYQGESTRTGWTLGIGAEYAFLENVSGFVEYNYFDFGTEKFGLEPQVPGLPKAFVDIEESRSVVRAGINFRFGNGL